MQTALRQDLPAPPPRVPETGELRLLRRVAQEGRLSRSVEPEGMCALLRSQPAAAAEAYGEALLRLLPRATGRRVTVHRPGAGSCSFDEAWLLGLLRAVRAGDGDSLHFALASRVARHMRGQVRFLAEGLARRGDAADPQAI